MYNSVQRDLSVFTGPCTCTPLLVKVMEVYIRSTLLLLWEFVQYFWYVLLT